MSTLRLRKKPLTEVVRNFDAFPKVPESVEEEKKASGGVVSIICWCVIIWLVISELIYYSQIHFNYKFSVDVEYETKLQLDIDMTVATPCDAIGADVMDATNQPLAFAYSKLKMEPARFELTATQRMYFQMLQNLHKQQASEFQGLDHLLYATKNLAEEIHKNEGAPGAVAHRDACRIHGFVRVNKVAGNFHVSPGKSLPIDGGGHAHISFFGSGFASNFSHRIEKLSFGPRVFGLVNPLDGVEKISQNMMDLYQYYVQIVPTKVRTTHGETIETCQYSMTQRNRAIDHSGGSHGTPGIFIKYDLSAIMVDVRESRNSKIELLVRLCAIIGGVFATSGFLNNFVGWLVDFAFCRWTGKKMGDINSKKLENQQVQYDDAQNGYVSQKAVDSQTFVT